MKTVKRICSVMLILMVIAFAGCAVSPEPFVYEPDHELKKGPGLFSGEEGAFTIYRKPAVENEGGAAK